MELKDMLDIDELENALRDNKSLDELNDELYVLVENINAKLEQEKKDKEAAAAKEKELWDQRSMAALHIYKYLELLGLTSKDRYESEQITDITDALEKLEPLVKKAGYDQFIKFLLKLKVDKTADGITKFMFAPSFKFAGSEGAVKQSDVKTDKKRTMNREDDILANFLNEILR